MAGNILTEKVGKLGEKNERNRWLGQVGKEYFYGQQRKTGKAS